MRTKLAKTPLCAVALALWVAVLLGSPQGALGQDSVYDGGLFELGDAQAPPGFPGMANILLSTEQSGPDWEDVFDADGAWRDDDGNGVPDFQELYGGYWAVFSADDVSLGSGFESTALHPDGRIYNATAAAQHDIGNAYVYWTVDSIGNLVLFAAAERLGGGDSHVEFEFNQDLIRLGRGGYGRGEPWQLVGDRLSGDILIKATFAEGALGTVEASAWDGSTWLPLGAIAGESCNAGETLCAVCNSSEIDGGPWANFDTAGDPEQISGGHFVEVGVNVGALLGAQPDFTTVRLRTPQDAAFGYFSQGN